MPMLLHRLASSASNAVNSVREIRPPFPFEYSPRMAASFRFPDAGYGIKLSAHLDGLGCQAELSCWPRISGLIPGIFSRMRQLTPSRYSLGSLQIMKKERPVLLSFHAMRLLAAVCILSFVAGQAEATAKLEAKLDLDPASHTATVRAPTLKGNHYRVESSTNLTDWTVVRGSRTSDGSNLAYTADITGKPRVYYRVVESTGPSVISHTTAAQGETFSSEPFEHTNFVADLIFTMPAVVDGSTDFLLLEIGGTSSGTVVAVVDGKLVITAGESGASVVTYSGASTLLPSLSYALRIVAKPEAAAGQDSFEVSLWPADEAFATFIVQESSLSLSGFVGTGGGGLGVANGALFSGGLSLPTSAPPAGTIQHFSAYDPDAATQTTQVPIEPEPPIKYGPNMLASGGDFSNGLTDWRPYSQSSLIPPDFNVVDGQVVISNIPDTNGSFVRLFYRPAITLEAGKFYTVRFDAKSTAKRVIAARWAHGGSLGYGQYDSIEQPIDTEMKTYEIVYAHTGPTDSTGQFAFDLGFSTQEITIDNVELREGGVPYLRRPQLLVTNSGKAVKDVATWENVRRPELLKMLRDEMLGYPPDPSTYTINYRHVSTVDIFSGVGIRKLVDITINGPYGSLVMRTPIYLPKNAVGPVPVIIYVKQRDAIIGTAPSASEIPLVDVIFPRGYGVVVLNGGYLASERPDQEYPLLDLFNNSFVTTGKRVRSETEWGSMAMWSWAGSLIIDYLETDPAIDSKKIGAVGHSRGGKAALWFGVTDQRVGLVLPNNSGGGGTKLYRHRGYNSEQLDAAWTTVSRSRWFSDAYEKYSGTGDANFDGKDMTLPWESYTFMAMIAPRLLATGASSTDWTADPVADWQAMTFVQPVYQLYGKLDKIWKLTDGPYDMSKKTVLRNGNLQHHKKPAGHSFTSGDWADYLDFASLHWK